jgi:hypothetical protein
LRARSFNVVLAPPEAPRARKKSRGR